jgi:tRNA(fMet)-specific endonuclease VapC
MKYQLDTDWLIDYLAGNPTARSLIAPLLVDGVAISAVTYMEVYEGIEAGSALRDNERAFRNVLRSVKVLPMNRTVARRAAQIRVELRAQGRLPRSQALDIVIAATAITHNLTLVTRNLDDYRRIPELKLY